MRVFGSVRQRIEVATEQITREAENVAVKSGLGINVYQQPSNSELGEASPAPVSFFTYGDFSAPQLSQSGSV